ncbi:unnamed protein product [Plasmodium vivax]|uniref:(malaria parasite P. vivax) hypothetical protein n=1 Tax=Plasmodium vivax TaxID=5855 RepID=A0A8S4H5X8_PLAVI|nr:unnamed protein product [Plasmodium vivax]
MAESIYDYVSSFHKYEEIKNSLTQDNTISTLYQCDTKLFSQGCDNPTFINNCHLATSYLMQLNPTNNSINITEACKYFNYWFYSVVLFEGRYQYDLPNFYKNLSYFQEEDICTEYIENISDDISTKIKNLIYIYKNLNEISNSTCSDNCTCAKNCYEKYMLYKDTCTQGKDKNLCRELENFREKYNSLTESFTPIGSWIHTKLTGGKKCENKQHQKTEKLQYTTEYQENPYRVSYQPSRYS